MSLQIRGLKDRGGSSWVEDPVDGESVCAVRHEGEDVAGKDPQTCGTRTPCGAFQGSAGLQSTVLTVMTNPRPITMTEWEPPHTQLSRPSQLNSFHSTMLPRPGVPGTSHPYPPPPLRVTGRTEAMGTQLAASQAGHTCELLFPRGSKFWKMCG